MSHEDGKYYKAVTQKLHTEPIKTTAIEVTYDELQKIKSERGEGKLGSSGK